jgi:hypothetical protein
MEFQEIKLLLDQTAVRILQGPNAAMVLSFLHRAFKRHLRVARNSCSMKAKASLSSGRSRSRAKSKFRA